MFKELREMNEYIQKKQERIDELRSAMTSISVSYNERVQTSMHDKMADMMCRIVVMENELDAMIDDYAEMKSRAKATIYMLDNEVWRDILYTHYIECKTLSQIAKAQGTTLNSIRAKNNRGLKALKKLLTKHNPSDIG